MFDAWLVRRLQLRADEQQQGGSMWRIGYFGVLVNVCVTWIHSWTSPGRACLITSTTKTSTKWRSNWRRQTCTTAATSLNTIVSCLLLEKARDFCAEAAVFDWFCLQHYITAPYYHHALCSVITSALKSSSDMTVVCLELFTQEASVQITFSSTSLRRLYTTCKN